MSRLTDMIVTFKVATCCPVDDITHNVDINQFVKLEPAEIDGLPACGATDGHPGNDKMHNIPIALAKADCQKLTLVPNLTHETTGWSNKWLTKLSKEEYQKLERQTKCEHCKIPCRTSTGPPLSCKGDLTSKWTCSECAEMVATDFCCTKGCPWSDEYL